MVCKKDDFIVDVFPTFATTYIMDNDSLPRDLGRRLGNLADLPDALKEQLQAAKMSELDRSIIDTIGALDGVANVDEILVGLYRATGEVHKRQYISNKLYRMAQSKQIASVPRKKGVYSTI
ncbi:MAG: hypothetical protein LKF30_03660 [Sphingobium sp.]|mgnify:FL=1|nr:hypothetical protein [Sphingobium sp.]